MAEQYAIYLRKSRKDDDYAGGNSLEETLRTHEKTLLALAKAQSLSITRVYKEVVSGDTISDRPEIQKLLDEVSAGLFSGVLVMDIDRLARGDTSDQGLIAKAFSYSHTKIITPVKTYDPDNEFDEEYFEFGLFMSRREYKIITRRILRGRKAAVLDGRWIYNKAPYGYRRVKLEGEKGYTLEFDENADNARLIFQLYASGLGAQRVCRALAERGITNSAGRPWSPASVLEILHNVTYLGLSKFGSRPSVSRLENGVRKVSEPRVEDYLTAKARWPALIDQETWDQCQFNLRNNKLTAANTTKGLQNPLAGLVYCSECGKSMSRLWDQRKNTMFLLCSTMNCPTAGSKLPFVEEAVLDALRDMLPVNTDADQLNSADSLKKEVKALTRQLGTLEDQLQRLQKQKYALHDLLEQGVYTVDVFLERQAKLSQDVEAAEKLHESVKKDLESKKRSLDNSVNLIPRIRATVETYDSLKNPEAKNLALKSVLQRVVYHKTGRGTKNRPAPFSLELFLKA